MTETGIEKACFGLVQATRTGPQDSAVVQEAAKKFVEVARHFVSPELEIDEALIARAVRYLRIHAMPGMDEDTEWFRDMLMALLEVARPNTGLDDEDKEFLRDMLTGINSMLED